MQDSVPPWDQIGYFQTPREVTFTMDGAAHQAATFDPNRVLLVFSAFGGSNITVSTKAQTDVNHGVSLINQTGPLILNHAWWGPLVNAEWFYFGPAGPQLTVISVSVKDWPKAKINDTATLIAAVRKSYHSGWRANAGVRAKR